MKRSREIAARVWCDQDMRDVEMDVDAAEQIAIVIESVRQAHLHPEGPHGIPNRRNFDDELACLLNKYSKENGSNTPDFVLSEYIRSCLSAFNDATRAREQWYGRPFSPGSLSWTDINISKGD